MQANFRLSLRLRLRPEKKSISRASIECSQELKTLSTTFHSLRGAFHFLRGAFLSFVWLPALVWMSSLWHLLDNLQTLADNHQTSEIKLPLAAYKLFFQFQDISALGNCYSFEMHFIEKGKWHLNQILRLKAKLTVGWTERLLHFFSKLKP